MHCLWYTNVGYCCCDPLLLPLYIISDSTHAMSVIIFVSLDCFIVYFTDVFIVRALLLYNVIYLLMC